MPPVDDYAIRHIETVYWCIRDYLPHPCASPDGIEFVEALLPVDVLGMTSYLHRNRVLLSPIVVAGLAWHPHSGQHHSTVIHELTHIAQMRRYGPILWGLLNLPGIRILHTERQARENEEACRDML